MSRRASANGDPQRDIMRCRRREEPASVLVARLFGDRHLKPRELVGCFRLTDSVAAARVPGGIELIGVFDDHRLEREGLERRLRTAMAGARVDVEWLRFPDDGVTFEALVQRGRAALQARNGHGSRLRAAERIGSATAVGSRR